MANALDTYEVETVMLGELEVTITLEAHEEFDSIEDQHDFEDEEHRTETYNFASLYEPWGWCCIKVVASCGEVEGDAYLGCCMYKSGPDFVDGGYYDDMKDEAVKDLKATLQKHSELAKLAGISA